MTKDLTSGSPLKVILLFSLPLVLGNLFQQFYALADTIIVGRFCGVSALASVGATGSVNYLILGFVIGVCNGFAIPIAQLFGARDYSDLRRHVANAAWLCIAASVVLTISTVALTRPMMQLMQTPDDIIDGAVIYIGWIFAGIPFIFLYNMVAAIMRALGDSKTPLYFLILTSALNIGLDLLFIIPFQMGVLGAALATDISQVISGVLSFIYLSRKFDVLKMQKPDFAYSKKACARLLGIGIPMGLQCSITAIGSVIMQWAVNVLGSTAVAAVTAAGKTQGLLTVPMESVGTAMATYAGQNLGASRMDRVRQGVNSAMLIILIYGVASAFVLHFTDVQIMSLFLDTAKEVDIVAMGREYLFWNSVFFVPLGALIIWRYTIQGLGFSSLAMLAGVAEMVARTAVAIVLVPILGYFGAELSNPAAWIAACLFLYPAYRWTCRQLDNRLLTARLHIQGDHAETVL
ncbi:MATE family efflux transporter [Gemmiger formicilis]|uniref:MATE family efflux transporter n=4 Tax=Gemmiger formicilis TaxID=745368 RepID=UPI003AAE3715